MAKTHWFKIGFCFGLIVFVALSLNLLTYRVCLWNGRLDHLPQGLPVWSNRDVASFDRRTFAELQGKMVSYEQEVARLRRQVAIQSPKQQPQQHVQSVDCESSPAHEAYQPKTRHTVIQWDSFDEQYSFSSYMNTQGQPAEKRQGDSERNFVDIKEAALQLLNNRDHRDMRLVKLVHGYRREDSLRGTEYILDLFLALPDGSPVSQRVHILRPFKETILESVQTYRDLNIRISLIMPLSQRLDIFKQFMYRFRKCCIGQKFVDVFLVVVYFGQDNLKDVKELLGK